MRKKGEAIVDSKYEGKRASRSALYGNGSDEEEDDEDSEIDHGEDDEDQDDEVYEGEFADLLGPAGTDEDSNQDEEESEGEGQDDEDEGSMEDDQDEEEIEEEEEEEEERPAKKTTAKQQDERVMLKELKQAASADVEKGRDVKKQLVCNNPVSFVFPILILCSYNVQAFCDNLLESRIRLQKATTSSNLLPQPFLAPSYFSHPSLTTEVQSTFSELASLSEELFSLRQELAKENEKLEMEDGFGESRKRKRRTVEEGDTDDWMMDTLKDLGSLETA